MNSTTELVRVRINGNDVEATVPDIRALLGLDAETGGVNVAPARSKPATKRTAPTKNAAKKETAGESTDDDGVNVDTDAVIEWQIATGRRTSKAGRKPNAEAIREYLEAHGQQVA